MILLDFIHFSTLFSNILHKITICYITVFRAILNIGNDTNLCYKENYTAYSCYKSFHKLFLVINLFIND